MAIAAVIGLTGCGGGGVGVANDGGAKAAELGVGDTTDLGDLVSSMKVDLTLDSVDSEFQCPEPPYDAEPNQRYVRFNVTLAPKDGKKTGPLSSFEWVAVDKAGTESKVDWRVAQLCVPPKEQVPLGFTDDKPVKGSLIFPVPAGTTAVIGRVPWIDPQPSLTLKVS
ncbi:hypothetical protein [Knoellia remsis]|uniref:hypothetical protein n=1 Tax=Knoellia remsis TaxID=407159 RepID=UPI0011B25846|nr:hypothetical protein [Knoellia remsis]